jgi:hypothetical protein
MLTFMSHTIEKILDRLLVSIPLRFFKRNIVMHVDSTFRASRYAFVYFKTDPLFSPRLRNAYIHTNNAEIVKILDILNRLGYIVDLVDRNAKWDEVEPMLSKQYDIYFANAAGNSAPLHQKINERISAKVRIFFAAGPEPVISNFLVESRNRNFDSRSGLVSERRRLVKGDGFEKRFSKIDAIFCVGNSFSENTYSRYGLPTFRINPSTSPLIKFDNHAATKKCPNHFLYFGGNGLLCKGLDLVLEAFDGLENVQLDICGPVNELDFWGHYRTLLERNPNIKFHGFIRVGGKKFSEITSTAAFQIYPAAAEGCATSVVTCMRRGVIPVTTFESGIECNGYGVKIRDISVSAIRSLILDLKNMSNEEMRRRVIGTYLASMKYTSEGFANSFEAALLKTLELKGKNG